MHHHEHAFSEHADFDGTPDDHLWFVVAVLSLASFVFIVAYLYTFTTHESWAPIVREHASKPSETNDDDAADSTDTPDPSEYGADGQSTRSSTLDSFPSVVKNASFFDRVIGHSRHEGGGSLRPFRATSMLFATLPAAFVAYRHKLSADAVLDARN